MSKEKYFGMSPRIARWKINSTLETWLGERADYSEFWKKVYILYYRLFDSRYYKGGIEMINKVIEVHKEDFVGLDKNYIVRDMLYCLHRFGFSFQDYCIYGFVNRTLQCRKSFVSDKLRYYYCDILNEPFVEQMMTDKYTCYQKYRKFFKRDVLGCHSESDKKSFSSFVEKHKCFVFKPLEEHSGHGIKIVDANNVDVDTFFTEMLKKGAFIVEELIEQGEELAVMHPQSVNSLRVVTFAIGDKVNIIGVTWRIGVGDAVMDNAGSGGIYASVDFKYGFIQTDAVNYRGEHFNVHPDTKVQIVGFQMPKWNEALDLINEMATAVKGTTLVSWDIAYSTKGWLMIEANDNGDWSLMQSNKKIGKKNELFSYMDQYLARAYE